MLWREGWLVAPAESAKLAEALIASPITQGGQAPGTINADPGSSMTSKPVAQPLLDLGVARPHVSNDNLYSEAGFKTLKYFPAFPERFGSIQDARTFCAWFFDYYNHEHRHSTWPPHPSLGSSRHRHQGACPAGFSPRSRLRRPPRALRQTTHPAQAAHRRLDQPANPRVLIQTRR